MAFIYCFSKNDLYHKIDLTYEHPLDALDDLNEKEDDSYKFSLAVFLEEDIEQKLSLIFYILREFEKSNNIIDGVHSDKILAIFLLMSDNIFRNTEEFSCSEYEDDEEDEDDEDEEDDDEDDEEEDDEEEDDEEDEDEDEEDDEEEKS